MNTEHMIYIVDDDAGFRKSLVWMLENEKLTCCAVESAAEFLSLSKANCPSCLILDMYMPGMAGMELLNEMSTRPGLLMPVIVLTGVGSIASAVQSMKLGARDFLEKPIDHQDLLQKVHQALASDAAHRERADQMSEMRQRISQLTQRERQVLKLLCEGNSSKQMGLKLNISAKTISIHRWHLMKKMGAASATEAVQFALRAGAA